MYDYSNIEQDYLDETNSDSQDFWTGFDYPQSFSLHQRNPKKPLREKNNSKNHVPHSEKPPQVVAKRNARERRRVQAVNNAFVKLRDAVPVHNARGKRISKLKTLLHAIDYIRAMDNILQECGSYSPSFEMMGCAFQKNTNYMASADWNVEKEGFPANKYFS